jgi:hypothetical protein
MTRFFQDDGEERAFEWSWPVGQEPPARVEVAVVRMGDNPNSTANEIFRRVYILGPGAEPPVRAMIADEPGAWAAHVRAQAQEEIWGPWSERLDWITAPKQDVPIPGTAVLGFLVMGAGLWLLRKRRALQ